MLQFTDYNRFILRNKFGTYHGSIRRTADGFYCGFFDHDMNDAPLHDAGIKNYAKLWFELLDYTDYSGGTWPWCKTKEDVITILRYLNSFQDQPDIFISFLDYC